MYAGDHGAWLRLREYSHEAVKHSVGGYVGGEAHTNGIESFWSLLKRGYCGTHHDMSEKYLHRHVSEFANRHRVRKPDTEDQMLSLPARGMEDKWLRYREPVQ